MDKRPTEHQRDTYHAFQELILEYEVYSTILSGDEEGN